MNPLDSLRSGLDFDDVHLVQKYNDNESRQLIDLKTRLGPYVFELPIISSNMNTITGAKMCAAMYLNGGLGILHRSFSTLEHFSCELQTIKNIARSGSHDPLSNPIIGFSIGVDNSSDSFVRELFGLYRTIIKQTPIIVCIDVAHGYHEKVAKIIADIKSGYLLDFQSECDNVYIIAGNISTYSGALFLYDAGADCVKVGIGSGFACRTRKMTGVGYPQLTALEEVHAARAAVITKRKNQDQLYNKQLGIIADGGCSNVGHIAKALVYADTVMLGRMLAGTTETPGAVTRTDSGFMKKYSGSSTYEAKGHTSFVEGESMEVPFIGKVKYVLNGIREGLQSSISLSGGKDLKSFRENAEFIRVSPNSKNY